MSNPSLDLDRAIQAQQLLDNPLYQESFKTVREALHKAWESAPVRDVEGQHELKLMLKLLGDLEQNISRVIDSGKLAKIEIERKNTKWYERAAWVN